MRVGEDSAGAPRLAAPAPRADKPLRTATPWRLGDAADMGAVALGWQVLSAILFAATRAQGAYPALAGVLWGLGGAMLIDQLARLRSYIVGGWQASHDLSMRTDSNTGRLKNVRGRRYGEDRYEEWAPGPVSARERNTIDLTAVALGLPWVWSAGLKALTIYFASAVATIALRRLWRSLRPAPPPPARNPNFEYDR